MEPFCSCNSNQICKTVSFSNQILGVVKSRRTIQKYLVQHYVVCLLLTSGEDQTEVIFVTAVTVGGSVKFLPAV